jgi:AcrR family transcriptional regulator
MAELLTPFHEEDVAATDPLSFNGTRRQKTEALGPRSRRTVGRILDATPEVLLTRGNAGTTIDEIARVADVSRASFYTYFTTKRDVLLAVGAHSAGVSEALVEALADVGPGRAELTSWVQRFFDLLDVHGSFAFAWTQAAHEDEAIRTAGMHRHLALCRRLGVLLAATADRSVEMPELTGLTAFSLMERSWNYGQIYRGSIERGDLIEQVANTVWAIARQRTPTARPAP